MDSYLVAYDIIPGNLQLLLVHVARGWHEGKLGAKEVIPSWRRTWKDQDALIRFFKGNQAAGAESLALPKGAGFRQKMCWRDQGHE